MIICLDSAFPPSPATAQAAAAAGIKGWFGYWSSAPYDGGSHFGLYHPWPEEAIEYVRVCSPKPVMFVSGGDDPVKIRDAAIRLNFRPCRDKETGVLDPADEQAWHDASGAGLYGNYWVHNAGLRVPFSIISASLGVGDPNATWWDRWPRPAGPCGYQWWNSHDEFGVTVDRGDYDDYFLEDDMDVYLLTHLLFGMAYGRPYGLAPTGTTTPSGYEPDADLVISRLKANPHDVGGTLGYLLSTTEGKAWAAKLAAIRTGSVGPDDDSAFVTKTALKTAIGGL